VLAAIHETSIQDIINDAMREQYDIEELNEMAESLLEESGVAEDDDLGGVDANDVEASVAGDSGQASAGTQE
jgi:uncharacterized protein YqeY